MKRSKTYQNHLARDLLVLNTKVEGIGTSVEEVVVGIAEVGAMIEIGTEAAMKKVAEMLKVKNLLIIIINIGTTSTRGNIQIII